jgi:hypothetical protein
MVDEIIKQDKNKVPVMAGVSDDEREEIIQVRIDPITKRLKVEGISGLSGDGVDTTFTIVDANTAYAIPPSPPNKPYTLIIYNTSNNDIFFRFSPGTTGGIKIAPDQSLLIDLGGGQQVYIYCAIPNTTINLSYKII